MRFGDFLGNSDLLATFTHLLQTNRFPHAILLEGPAGCGKRYLARLLAAALICEGDAPPCLTCKRCGNVLGGGHPDVFYAEGGQSAKSFHVDVIRALRTDAFITAREAPCKVFILAGAETMTDQAQNALLKILEEPPADVFIILTCQNAASLLPTIRSRTAAFTLSGVQPEQVIPLLQTLYPQKTPEEIEVAAAASGGVIGQAKTLLEEGGATETLELARQIAEEITAQNETGLITALASLDKKRELRAPVFNQLLFLLRDGVAAQNQSENFLSVHPITAKLLAQTLTQQQLSALYRVVEDGLTSLNQNANSPLLLTVLCANMRTAAGR